MTSPAVNNPTQTAPSANNPTFLEIKNWNKFQAANTFKWIKDYTNREDDLEFSRLTMFQRGLLEGLCRLRARTSRPIPYDAVYISSALQVIGVERHCVYRSLVVLVSRGFLVPCNQQLDFQENDRVEESRGEETRKEKKGEEGDADAFPLTQNPSGKPKINPGQLLADMREIWDFHVRSITWNHNPKELNEAVALADKYGLPDFLLAFDSWCFKDADEQVETKPCENLKLYLWKFFQQIDYYLKKSTHGDEYKRRERHCPSILGWTVANVPSGAVAQ